MKKLIVLILLIFNSAAFGQTNDCSTASKNYWAPKLTKYSTALGNTIAEEGNEPVVTESPDLQIWKKAVFETAKEMDITFSMTGDNSFVSLAKALLSDLMAGGALPDIRFDIADDFDSMDKVVLIGTASKRIQIDTDANSLQCESILNCSAPGQNVCQQFVDAWAKGVSAYKNPAYRLAPQKMAQLAIEYEKDWDNFFSEARSQTVLDRLLTARLNRKKLRNEDFQKAPDTQYFFAHPGVVMEYVENAADGEQFAASLSVEWFGVNRWRGCNLGFINMPFGLSIVSVYSDKAGTEDMGHGLMLHLYNAYSLGVVDRDGETGIFVTLDLMKALESKQAKVEKWKKKAEKYLK